MQKIRNDLKKTEFCLYIKEFTQSGGIELFNSEKSIGVECFVLVYAVSSHNSFFDVQNISKGIVQACGKETVFVVIGNKSDLKEEREVTYAEGKKLAKSLSCDFIETCMTNQDPAGDEALRRILLAAGDKAVEKSFTTINPVKREQCICVLQ